MDALKVIFPFSFNKSLVVSTIIYIIIAVIAGFIIHIAGFMTGWLPVIGAIIGLILRILGTIVEIYVIGGIILSILKYLNIVA